MSVPKLVQAVLSMSNIKSEPESREPREIEGGEAGREEGEFTVLHCNCISTLRRFTAREKQRTDCNKFKEL